MLQQSFITNKLEIGDLNPNGDTDPSFVMISSYCHHNLIINL